MTNNQQRSAVRRLAGLGGAVELRTHRVVIRLPHPKLFQLFARTAVVAILLLSFPWIISAIQTVGSRAAAQDPAAAFYFFSDLNRLGHLTASSRSIFIGDYVSILPLLISNRIEPVDADLKSQVADASVDFLLLDQAAADLDFADRVLMRGGVLSVLLSSDSGDRLDLRPDYKIVLRSPTVIAARRTETQTRSSSSSRKLLAVPESKAMILNKLEDAVLEPPTKRMQRKKTKYLPDLIEDSLAEFPRRVFVDVGPAGRSGSERWFERNYPKGESEFEVIQIDEVKGEGEGEGEGLGDWMSRNLREEEYVVMKAEAEVVEEMVKGGVIGLVDELFMECRNQWTRVEGEKGGRSSRAYWECLALYGRLKDQGVAVHQWWDLSYIN